MQRRSNLIYNENNLHRTVPEAIVIGQMAAAVNWNVPVLGYLSSDDSLSDKTIYTTFARTSVTSYTYYAQAVKYLVLKNGWKRVGYAGSDVPLNNRNRQAVTSALTAAGVSVQLMVTDANPTWQSIASSQAMVDLKANARG